MYLVDLTEDNLFDRIVLDNLAENATVTAANHQDLFRMRVCTQRQMRNHLLVRKLVSFAHLNGPIKRKDRPKRLGAKHLDMLVLGLSIKQDLFDLHRQALNQNFLFL